MAPPVGLGGAGEALWNRVTATEVGEEFNMRADERQNLEEACRTADLIEKLQGEIDGAETLLVPGSKGQRVLHPMVPEVRQQRALLGQLLGRLDIAESSGNPEWDHLSASERARKAAFAKHGRGR